MSKIKGKNTKPEMLVRRFLHANGFRYKLHDKSLPGKPDIVLSKYKTVVEIQGCFWHGHKNCDYFKLPESNIEFWQDKISGTVERDKINQSLLSYYGWQVIVIWECELKPKTLKNTLNISLLEKIRKHR